jgi:hypothetical protein
MHGRVGPRIEAELIGWGIGLDDGHHLAAFREFFELSRDGWESCVVADQEVPVIAGRDDKRPARAADGQRLSRLRLFGPLRPRTGIVEREVDDERAGGGIVAARGIIAASELGLAIAAFGPGHRKKQLNVVVESQAGEPGEFCAGQRDADHAR